MLRFVFFLLLAALSVDGCGDQTGGGAGVGGDGGTSGSGGMDGGFPCTEQGIRDAIAEGGGPHFFNCEGPTTVVTEAEIIIDNDVILDGGGRLTAAGPGAEGHRIFSVPEGVRAELRGFTVKLGGLVAGDGAGIANNGTLTIRDCVISRNTAGDISGDSSLKRGSGGGIRNVGEMAIIDSTISDNWSSWGDGGGISNAGSGTLTLTNSIVSGNRASDGDGGGIWNASSAALTITNSTVSGNSAGCEACPEFLGGIWNEGEMAMTDSTVSDNRGHGIRNTGTAMLIGSTVSRNGPGIGNAGEMAIIDSTVSGNSTDTNGGGIWNAGTLTVRSSTVSGNAAGEQGSAVYADDGSAIETALTLIDGDCASSVEDGVWVSNGYNIESRGDTCGFDQLTDQVDVTAEALKLGPLADNGGPTMTHALLLGSVAIDVIPEAACLDVDADGAPLKTDQRGELRPELGGSMCDVGAFEVQP